MTCLSYAAWTLWRLGYPEQARQKVAEALAWAQELSHPFSLAFALDFAGAGVNMFLREVPVVHTYTEMLMRLSQEQGFPYWLAWGTVRQGWVLAEQGQCEAGIAKMRQGMDAAQLTGAALSMSYILAQLADAYGKVGQGEEGLPLLAEALAQVTQTGERWYEAELHRLKGQLALQSQVQSLKSKVPSPQHPIPNTQAEAEACFHKALEVAQQQSARSLELRAAMSLARLWQQQGKKREAHQLLSGIYGWFTEGFDTVDLKEAKALLKALS
jgi:predicted ATPase